MIGKVIFIIGKVNFDLFTINYYFKIIIRCATIDLKYQIFISFKNFMIY